MKKGSPRTVKARLSKCRAAVRRAHDSTYELSEARESLVLALAHIVDAQRHIRRFTRLTGRAI